MTGPTTTATTRRTLLVLSSTTARSFGANQTGAKTFNVSVKAEDDHDTTAYTINVVVESERQWTADERAEALLNKTFEISVTINGPDSVKDAIIDALRDYLPCPVC